MHWKVQQLEFFSIKTEEDSESHFSLLPEDLFADSGCLELIIGSDPSGGDAEGVQLGACQGCERKSLVS